MTGKTDIVETSTGGDKKRLIIYMDKDRNNSQAFILTKEERYELFIKLHEEFKDMN